MPIQTKHDPYDQAYFDNYFRKEKARNRSKYLANKQANILKSAEWRKKHPERAAIIARRARIKFIYKVDLEYIDNLWDKQNNRCASCSSELKPAAAVIDHDHKTGKVRGILCRRCNLLVAYLENNPKILPSVLDYLKRSENADSN
jgi:hypothetical protein